MQNLPRLLIKIEQWSEFKAVEIFGSANDNNIGATSVCSFACSEKLIVAHSCRAVLVSIHLQCVNKKSKNSA